MLHFGTFFGFYVFTLYVATAVHCCSAAGPTNMWASKNPCKISVAATPSSAAACRPFPGMYEQ